MKIAIIELDKNNRARNLRIKDEETKQDIKFVCSQQDLNKVSELLDTVATKQLTLYKARFTI